MREATSQKNGGKYLYVFNYIIMHLTTAILSVESCNVVVTALLHVTIRLNIIIDISQI